MNASIQIVRSSRPLWLLLFVLLTLVVLVPTPQVYAKKRIKATTPVFWDGTVMAMPKSDRTARESDSTFSPPSAGSLPVSNNLNSPETVIGSDGRTQVLDTTSTPANRIGLLEITFPTVGTVFCTGFLVSPDRVVTSAVCVYDYNNQEFMTAATFYPGRNGDTQPYGNVTVSSASVLAGWINSGAAKWNVGLVFLSSDIGSTVGWFGYGKDSSNTLFLKHKATVGGYPTDKPYGTQWTMNGKIQQVTKTLLSYSIDTDGELGAPLYGNFFFRGFNCDPCAAGINNYGVGGASTKNSATRITKKTYKFIRDTVPPP